MLHCISSMKAILSFCWFREKTKSPLIKKKSWNQFSFIYFGCFIFCNLYPVYCVLNILTFDFTNADSQSNLFTCFTTIITIIIIVLKITLFNAMIATVWKYQSKCYKMHCLFYLRQKNEIIVAELTLPYSARSWNS